MNLYEAIYVRRSVRQYQMTSIDPTIISKVQKFCSEITPLVPGIRTEFGLTENPTGKKRLKGFFGVHAPYYLSLYTEQRDRAEMNAGYIGEQISLYLLTLGIGSCFLGSSRAVDTPKERNDKKLVFVIAFGYPKSPLTRSSADAKRLPMKDLLVYSDHPAKWTSTVLEAARLAPSALNQQPWRFAAIGRRIHIFSRKSGAGHAKRFDEINFGILCAHIAIASDELWLDLDLIRLENISQKNFKANQYILSAIARTTDWDQGGRSEDEDADMDEDLSSDERDSTTDIAEGNTDDLRDAGDAVSFAQDSLDSPSFDENAQAAVSDRTEETQNDIHVSIDSSDQEKEHLKIWRHHKTRQQ